MQTPPPLPPEARSPLALHAGNTSTHVVALPERFDAFANVQLLPELDAGGHATDRPVVVDGRAVKFADRHGLQSLVDARLALLDAGSDLIVGAPSIELRVTLELTGFDLLLTVISGGAA